MAITKLDEHFTGGLSDWKDLELKIGAAVSLLIRETAKEPGLQRIVNPILEELQSGLDKGRSIVRGGQQLVAEERKTLDDITDAVSDK